MKQYPIWNIIPSCIYKGDKSYGVKDRGDVEVRIGTSSNNSHTFLRHKTTHKKLDNGDREYHFYLDDVLVKRALLPKGSDNAHLIPLALSDDADVKELPVLEAGY